jgi:carbon storage regulator
MLVLTRKSNQSIMIGDEVKVTVLSVIGEKVRIGIEAPTDVPVFRTEIYLEIQNKQTREDVQDSDSSANVNDSLRKLGESS